MAEERQTPKISKQMQKPYQENMEQDVDLSRATMIKQPMDEPLGLNPAEFMQKPQVEKKRELDIIHEVMEHH